MHVRILSVLLLCMFLIGCYRDNEESLAPCGAEARGVRYSRVIAILSANGCYGCHVGAAPEGGISLEQYPSVKALVDNGRLLGAITHAAGFVPMPQGAAKMNDCDIDWIRTWINEGAHEH